MYIYIYVLYTYRYRYVKTYVHGSPPPNNDSKEELLAKGMYRYVSVHPAIEELRWQILRKVFLESSILPPIQGDVLVCINASRNCEFFDTKLICVKCTQHAPDQIADGKIPFSILTRPHSAAVYPSSYLPNVFHI